MAKTLHANQTQKIDRPFLQPIYLVHIETASETLYFSDRCLSYNGHNYEDYLCDLPALGQAIEQLGGASNLSAQLHFSNARFRTYNTLLEFFDANPITKREADIFVLYTDTGETFGSDVSTKLVRVGIGEFKEITLQKFSAELMSIQHLLDSKSPFVQINRTNWPQADPAAIGKYENIIYGSIDDVPCHCVKTGAISSLFLDIEATTTTIYLSEVDFPMAFLSAGTIRIDDEQITYASVSVANKSLNGCSRGRNSTTPRIHKRGAPVWQVISEYKYLVSGHICKAVTDVMVDKIRVSTGDYTVNLNEGGKTVITFSSKALTKIQGTHRHSLIGNIVVIHPASSVFANDGAWWSVSGTAGNIRDQSEDTNVSATISIVAAGSSTRQAYVQANFNAWTGPTPSAVYLAIVHRSTFKGTYTALKVTNPGGVGELAGRDEVSAKVTQKFLLPTVSVPTQVLIYATYVGTDTQPYISTDIYEVWLEVECNSDESPADGVWGRPQDVFAPLVTCDVEGYQDDVGGTYTGVASALIENPSDIRRHLLVAVLGRSAPEIGTSFATVRSTYANRVIGGYLFACILSRLGSVPSEIFRSFDFQSRSQMREDGGKFELIFNDTIDQTSVLTFDEDDAETGKLIGDPVFNQTPQENIKNFIRAKYFLDWSGFKENKKYGEYFSQVERDNSASIIKYGTLYEDIEFPAVKSDLMAEDVTDWILVQKKDVLKSVNLLADWSARILEKGDYFTLIHDFWSGLKWRTLKIEEIPESQQFRIEAMQFIAFEGTAIEALQDCETIGDWSTDSAVSGSIVLSADAVDYKQGIKSVRADVVRYPKKVYNETGTTIGSFGYAASNKFWAQGFKPGSDFDAKALGSLLYKKGSPPDITISIYDNNAGIPGALLGSATIAATSVPANAFNASPNDFIFGILGATIALTSGTLYWLVMSVPSNSTANYYRFKYSATNVFGDATEKLRYGSTIAVTFATARDLVFRIGAAGDALNKYIFATIAAKDISAKSFMRSWLKGSKAGSYLSHSFGEAAIGEQNLPVTLVSAENWERMSSDITGIATADRDGVTKVGFKITNVDTDFWYKFDYLIGN